MKDLIGYDHIIEDSMRMVIYETLKKIEKSGLPGDHYFVITFLTKLPGVVIPETLLARYPEEMTIVMQNQFKSLTVMPETFKVALSFAGKFENLTIPFKAVSSFCDPSINFALKFSMSYVAEDSQEKLSQKDARSVDNCEANDENKSIDLSAKVISLDAFRKTLKPKNS